MSIKRLAGALLVLGLLLPCAAQSAAVTIDGTLDLHIFRFAWETTAHIS